MAPPDSGRAGRQERRGKPRLIGLDILLSESDRFSSTALVRNPGSDADRSGIAELARRLPDGDAVLADAFSAAPTVLGFVLEPGAGEVPLGRLFWRAGTFGRQSVRSAERARPRATSVVEGASHVVMISYSEAVANVIEDAATAH